MRRHASGCAFSFATWDPQTGAGVPRKRVCLWATPLSV